MKNFEKQASPLLEKFYISELKNHLVKLIKLVRELTITKSVNNDSFARFFSKADELRKKLVEIIKNIPKPESEVEDWVQNLNNQNLLTLVLLVEVAIRESRLLNEEQAPVRFANGAKDKEFQKNKRNANRLVQFARGFILAIEAARPVLDDSAQRGAPQAST